MDRLPENGGEMIKSPGVLASALIAVFEAACVFLTSFLLGAGHAAAAGALFLIAAVFVSAAIIHLKFMLSAAAPILGTACAIIAGADLTVAFSVLAAVFTFSLVVSVILMRGGSVVGAFLFSSSAFFAAFAALIVFALTVRFGSFAAGVERIKETARDLIGVALNNFSAADLLGGEGVDSGAILSAAIFVSPAFLMIFSMAAAAVYLLLLRVLTGVLGSGKTLFGGGVRVSRPLAAIFLVLTFFSLLAGSLPDPWQYAVVNVNYALTAMFFAVGVIEIVRAFRKGGSKRTRITVIVIAAVFVFLGGPLSAATATFLIPALAYFGAWRSLKQRGGANPPENRGPES
ncbi:MAG: hypothetical protein IJS78_06145 [Clostridia bacterium]|nr:hypothetical protein [Clostridia bacterium]